MARDSFGRQITTKATMGFGAKVTLLVIGIFFLLASIATPLIIFMSKTRADMVKYGDFIYEVREEDGNIYYYIKEYIGQSTDRVVIPSEYNGSRVVGIMENAFNGNTNATVRKIKNIVFDTSIGGVSNIDAGAFKNLQSLQSLTLPKTLTNLTYDQKAGSPFQNCKISGDLIIEDLGAFYSTNIDGTFKKTLSISSFDNCSVSGKIKVLDSTGGIVPGEILQAFGPLGASECVLESAVNVYSLGETSFDNWETLTDLTVYTNSDRIDYTKNQNLSDKFSFENSTALERLTILCGDDSSVYSSLSQKFRNAKNLTTITFGDGILSLKDNVLAGYCTKNNDASYTYNHLRYIFVSNNEKANETTGQIERSGISLDADVFGNANVNNNVKIYFTNQGKSINNVVKVSSERIGTTITSDFFSMFAKPEYIRDLTIGYGVSAIADDAFSKLFVTNLADGYYKLRFEVEDSENDKSVTLVSNNASGNWLKSDKLRRIDVYGPVNPETEGEQIFKNFNTSDGYYHDRHSYNGVGDLSDTEFVVVFANDKSAESVVNTETDLQIPETQGNNPWSVYYDSQSAINVNSFDPTRGQSISYNAKSYDIIPLPLPVNDRLNDYYIRYWYIDKNGNGEYQTPESFTDENSNGVYDEGEEFVDANGNGVYDIGDYIVGDTDLVSSFKLDISNPNLDFVPGANNKVEYLYLLSYWVAKDYMTVTFDPNFNIVPNNGYGVIDYDVVNVFHNETTGLDEYLSHSIDTRTIYANSDSLVPYYYAGIDYTYAKFMKNKPLQNGGLYKYDNGSTIEAVGANKWPTAYIAGYTFIGWNTSPDGSGTSINNNTTSNLRQLFGEQTEITLYAIYSPITYTFRYNNNYSVVKGYYDLLQEGTSLAASDILVSPDEFDEQDALKRMGNTFVGLAIYNNNQTDPLAYFGKADDDNHYSEVDYVIKIRYNELKDYSVGEFLYLYDNQAFKLPESAFYVKIAGGALVSDEWKNPEIAAVNSNSIMFNQRDKSLTPVYLVNSYQFIYHSRPFGDSSDTTQNGTSCLFENIEIESLGIAYPPDFTAKGGYSINGVQIGVINGNGSVVGVNDTILTNYVGDANYSLLQLLALRSNKLASELTYDDCIASEIHIFPHYVPNEYKVYLRTLASVDNTVIDLTLVNGFGVTFGNNYTIPAFDSFSYQGEPIDYKGYHFDGWAEEANGPKVYEDNETFTYEYIGHVTLTAHWVANTYNLRFHNKNGDVVGDPVSVTYNEAYSAIGSGLLETISAGGTTGYVFSGVWTGEIDGAKIFEPNGDPSSVKIMLDAQDGSNINLYPQWAEKIYNLTLTNSITDLGQPLPIDHSYYNNIYSYLQSETLNGNSTTTTIGHSFNVVTSVPSGFVYTGLTINGETYTTSQTTSNTREVSVGDNEIIIYTDSTTPFVINDNFITTYHVNDSISVIANFRPKEFYVKMTGSSQTTGDTAVSGWLPASLNAGSASAITVRLIYGHNFLRYKDNLNNYSDSDETIRTEYVNAKFGGWEYNGSIINDLGVFANKADGYDPNDEIVLTARIIEYSSVTVTLNANGGQFESPSITSKVISVQQNHAYGTLETPTRNGYTFVGWFKEIAYTNEVTSATIADADAINHDLFAKWTADQFTVQFNVNNNDMPVSGSMSNQTATFDNENGLTLTQIGWTFVGHSFVRWHSQTTENWGSANDIVYSDKQTLTKNEINAIYDVVGKNGTYNLYAEWIVDRYALILSNVGQNGSMNVSPIAELPSTTFVVNNVTYYENTTTHYLYNGGRSFASMKVVTYNVSYGTLPTPTRTGYNFIGWFSVQYNDNATIDEQNRVTAETITEVPQNNKTITIYAYWQIKTTTITLDLNTNDASAQLNNDPTVVATYGENLPTIANRPTRTGYAFMGFFDDPVAGGNSHQYYNNESPITGTKIWQIEASTKTLYAHWQENTTIITLNNNAADATDGNVTSTTAIYNQPMTAIANVSTNFPTRTGYTFTGYYDNHVTSSGTKYYNADGTSAHIWDKVDAAITLYAGWDINSYTITYVDNSGAKQGVADSDYTVNFYITTQITLATIIRNGYEFTGWKVTSDTTNTNWAPDQTITNLNVGDGHYGNVTLTAQWEIILYTISYADNGGTKSGSYTTTYTINDAITLPTIEKTGYHLETNNNWEVTIADGNWALGDAYTNGASINAGKFGHITLTANWEANTYTIYLAAGAGAISNVAIHQDSVGLTKVSDTQLTATYGEEGIFTCTLTNVSYRFSGWTNSGNGDVTDNHPTNNPTTHVLNLTSTNNGTVTLTANYSPITYEISYAPNGGLLEGTPDVDYTKYFTIETQTITIATSIREGYSGQWIITGTSATMNWDNNVPYSFGQVISGPKYGDIVMTASWSANRYAITLDVNGSTTSSNQTIYAKYDSASLYASEQRTNNTYASITPPTRTGYTFTGEWTLTAGGNDTLITSSTSAASAGTLVEDVSDYTDSNSKWIKAEATTLYAKWNVNRYAVTLEANDGTSSTQIVYAEYDSNVLYAAQTGDTLASIVHPNRPGYMLQCWTTGQNQGNSVIDINDNLVANVNTYTDSNGKWIKDGATSLYALWEINKWDITINSQDGTVSKSAASTLDGKYHYNDTVTLTLTADSGYFIELSGNRMSLASIPSVTFNWGTVNDGDTVATVTFSMPDSNITINATFTSGSLTVTFNPNGGTITNLNGWTNTNDVITKSVIFGDPYVSLPYVSLPTVNKYGYSYIYQITQVNGVNLGTPVTVTSSSNCDYGFNHVISAVWTADNYTITYVDNGGTKQGTADVDYTVNFTIETDPIQLPTILRSGYELTNWEVTTANGNWTLNDTYSNGQTLNNPAKYGNVILTANWETEDFVITYVDNGGTKQGTADVDYTVNYTIETDPIQLPTISKTGYTLTNWEVTHANGNWGLGGTYSNGQTLNSPAKYGNITITANWTADTYTIEFDANGGSGTMADLHPTYDQPNSITLTANTFTKTGYHFNGWAETANGAKVYDDEQTLTTSDINTIYSKPGVGKNGYYTLYVVWEADTYAIVFHKNDNDATGTMSDIDLTFDQSNSIVLTANAFNKTGYHFDGWAESANGAKVYNDGATLTATDVNNILINGKLDSYNKYNLYAIWAADTFTIEFNGNGNTSGSTASINNATYDQTVTLFPNGFIKTGYHFAGWAESANGAKVYDDIATLTVAQVNNAYLTKLDINNKYQLYAIWEANTYTINLDGNGGAISNLAVAAGAPELSVKTANAALTATYDSTGRFTCTMAKTGYTFNGWTNSGNGTVTNNETLPTNTPDTTVRDLTSTNGDTVTLTANWSANTYYLAVNANGGEIPETNGWTGTGATSYAEVVFGSTYGKDTSGNDRAFPTPTRLGYSFEGWYSVQYADNAVVDSTKEVTTSTAVTTADDYIIYAYWINVKYTLTINVINGSGLASKPELDKIVYNEGISIVLAPNTGYNTTNPTIVTSPTTSVSQNGDILSLNMPASDLTITITLKANTYTIQLNANGGTITSLAVISGSPSLSVKTANSELTATYGLQGTFSCNIDKTGYTFNGWDYSGVGTVTDNITLPTNSPSTSVLNLTSENGGTVALTANYLANTYQITANANGGEFTLPNDWTGVTAGSTSGKYSTATRNVTFASEYPTLPTPTRTGYSFEGWYLIEYADDAVVDAANKVIAGETTVATANAHTLYAYWKIIVYEISYTPNGGSLEGTPDVDYTKHFTIETTLIIIATSIKNGYTGQWIITGTSEGMNWDNNVPYSFGQVINESRHGDIVMTASWSPNRYEITFMANNGTDPEESQTAYAKFDSASLYASDQKTNNTPAVIVTPLKTGYTLDGWTLTRDGSDILLDNSHALVQNVTNYTDASGNWKKTDAVTVYAKWKKVRYEITLTTINSGVSLTNIIFRLNDNSTSTATTIYGEYNSDLFYVTNDITDTNSISSIINYNASTGYAFLGFYTAQTGGSKVFSNDGYLQAGVADYSSASPAKWIKTSATVLYAQFRANRYAITLNYNNGTSGSQIVYAKYGTSTLYAYSDAEINANSSLESVTVTITAPTYTGYTFTGNWTLTAGGSDTLITSSTSGSSTGTLQANVSGYTGAGGVWARANTAGVYAKWQRSRVTLTVNTTQSVSGVSVSGGNSSSLSATSGTSFSFATDYYLGSSDVVTFNYTIPTGYYIAQVYSANADLVLVNTPSIYSNSLTISGHIVNSTINITINPIVYTLKFLTNGGTLNFNNGSGNYAQGSSASGYAYYNAVSYNDADSLVIVGTPGFISSKTAPSHSHFDHWEYAVGNVDAGNNGFTSWTGSGVPKPTVSTSPSTAVGSVITMKPVWANDSYTVEFDLNGTVSGVSNVSVSDVLTLTKNASSDATPTTNNQNEIIKVSKSASYSDSLAISSHAIYTFTNQQSATYKVTGWAVSINNTEYTAANITEPTEFTTNNTGSSAAVVIATIESLANITLSNGAVISISPIVELNEVSVTLNIQFQGLDGQYWELKSITYGSQTMNVNGSVTGSVQVGATWDTVAKDLINELPITYNGSNYATITIRKISDHTKTETLKLIGYTDDLEYVYLEDSNDDIETNSYGYYKLRFNRCLDYDLVISGNNSSVSASSNENTIRFDRFISNTTVNLKTSADWLTGDEYNDFYGYNTTSGIVDSNGNSNAVSVSISGNEVTIQKYYGSGQSYIYNWLNNISRTGFVLSGVRIGSTSYSHGEMTASNCVIADRTSANVSDPTAGLTAATTVTLDWVYETTVYYEYGGSTVHSSITLYSSPTGANQTWGGLYTNENQSAFYTSIVPSDFNINTYTIHGFYYEDEDNGNSVRFDYIPTGLSNNLVGCVSDENGIFPNIASGKMMPSEVYADIVGASYAYFFTTSTKSVAVPNGVFNSTTGHYSYSSSRVVSRSEILAVIGGNPNQKPSTYNDRTLLGYCTNTSDITGTFIPFNTAVNFNGTNYKCVWGILVGVNKVGSLDLTLTSDQLFTGSGDNNNYVYTSISSGTSLTSGTNTFYMPVSWGHVESTINSTNYETLSVTTNYSSYFGAAHNCELTSGSVLDNSFTIKITGTTSSFILMREEDSDPGYGILVYYAYESTSAPIIGVDFFNVNDTVTLPYVGYNYDNSKFYLSTNGADTTLSNGTQFICWAEREYMEENYIPIPEMSGGSIHEGAGLMSFDGNVLFGVWGSPEVEFNYSSSDLDDFITITDEVGQRIIVEAGLTNGGNLLFIGNPTTKSSYVVEFDCQADTITFSTNNKVSVSASYDSTNQKYDLIINGFNADDSIGYVINISNSASSGGSSGGGGGGCSHNWEYLSGGTLYYIGGDDPEWCDFSGETLDGHQFGDHPLYLNTTWKCSICGAERIRDYPVCIEEYCPYYGQEQY